MIKEICWNVTTRCNQCCRYCHRFLSINDLSFEENKRILDNLISCGVSEITWTGGEALMLYGIEELIKSAYDKGIKNKLITNGKLLDTNKVKEIMPFLESITLSLDTVDSTINDKLGRGINHYENIKNILELLKSYEHIKIRINSVACSYTKTTFNELIEFLNKYPIYNWRIFKFMPLREKAVVNKNELSITTDEYKYIIDLIEEKSNIVTIDSRQESDMEKKYILILANGDIVVTKGGNDEIIGNALNDTFQVRELTEKVR